MKSDWSTSSFSAAFPPRKFENFVHKMHHTAKLGFCCSKVAWNKRHHKVPRETDLGANRLVWAHISIVLEKDISLMWQKSPMLYPWNNEMYFRCRTLRWKSWRNIPITSSRWRPRITLDWGLLRSSNYARKMEVSEMYWRHGYILPDVYRDFTLGIVKAYLLNAWCIMERLPFWIHTVYLAVTFTTPHAVLCIVCSNTGPKHHHVVVILPQSLSLLSRAANYNN